MKFGPIGSTNEQSKTCVGEACNGGSIPAQSAGPDDCFVV